MDFVRRTPWPPRTWSVPIAPRLVKSPNSIANGLPFDPKKVRECLSLAVKVYEGRAQLAFLYLPIVIHDGCVWDAVAVLVTRCMVCGSTPKISQ